MENADSILVKFDELIADLAKDSAREKRERIEAERVAAEAEATAEAEAEVEAEVEPEPEVEAGVEPEAEPGPAVKPAVKPEPEVKPDVKPELKLKVEAEPDVKPGLEPEAKPGVTPDAKPKPQPKSGRILEVKGLTKRFGSIVAVDSIDLAVEAGTIFGIVGPNGAGKTTTLSMITGLLRPNAGTVTVHDADVWANPAEAKRQMGVLPDRLRLFDRLTGNQFLYYAGVLRKLPKEMVRERIAQLANTLGLNEALGRLVADYSAGMTKKIALAAALIHSPRLLVLDEPFESVDPVSVASIVDILHKYVAAGGTVVLSSHSMDLIQRMCDTVAIIIDGKVLASGTVDEVRGEGSLEEKFIDLAGGITTVEGLEWLHSFSD